MSIQQENEIKALRLQVSGLNEQVGIFLTRIRELERELYDRDYQRKAARRNQVG